MNIHIYKWGGVGFSSNNFNIIDRFNLVQFIHLTQTKTFRLNSHII